MSYKEIGARIRALREDDGLTRDRLAERVGISSKFLYEIEMGKKGFSAETLRRLSIALDTSSDYLLSGMGEQKLCIMSEQM